MRWSPKAADAAILEWCRIAHVRHDLRHARFGLMGHVLNTMLDMQSDPAAVTAVFGAHVYPCEADEIMTEYAPLTADDPAVREMSGRSSTSFSSTGKRLYESKERHVGDERKTFSDDREETMYEAGEKLFRHALDRRPVEWVVSMHAGMGFASSNFKICLGTGHSAVVSIQPRESVRQNGKS